jgi:predicted P-loop ATPase/GTPase
VLGRNNSNWQNVNNGIQIDQQTVNEKYKYKEKRASHELGINVVKDETKHFALSKSMLYVIAATTILGILVTILLLILI